MVFYVTLSTDIDECALRTPKCHKKANCQNTLGSYTCTCNLGYYGSGFNCSSKYANSLEHDSILVGVLTREIRFLSLFFFSTLRTACITLFLSIYLRCQVFPYYVKQRINLNVSLNLGSGSTNTRALRM